MNYLPKESLNIGKYSMARNWDPDLWEIIHINKQCDCNYTSIFKRCSAKWNKVKHVYITVK